MKLRGDRDREVSFQVSEFPSFEISNFEISKLQAATTTLQHKILSVYGNTLFLHVNICCKQWNHGYGYICSQSLVRLGLNLRLSIGMPRTVHRSPYSKAMRNIACPWNATQQLLFGPYELALLLRGLWCCGAVMPHGPTPTHQTTNERAGTARQVEGSPLAVEIIHWSRMETCERWTS